MSSLFIGENLNFFKPRYYWNPSFVSETTTWDDEYLPKWVKVKPKTYADKKVEVVAGKSVIGETSWGYLQKKFVAVSEVESRLQIAHIYYPGWQVYINGIKKEIDYDNDYGLMTISVPEGKNEVIFSFERTWWRTVSETVSLFGFLVFVFFVAKNFSQEKKMKLFLGLKRNWPVWFFFIFWLFFFSFRLTKIPPGINIDESSIGYNASLIADTLHDENGRFLPVFFLTIGQKDWKQPVRIYATALFFRFFGNNYFNLRFVSVILAVFSGIIFYLFLRLFFSRLVSVLGTFFLFSSPSMLIQSHLALENIDCLPFFLLWLYFLLSF